MEKIGLKQTSELINSLNIEPVLNNRVRQVRWLYNNSNKCTKVYEEKLVRLMVFKLKQRIVQLESELTKLQLKNGKLPITHVSKQRELLIRYMGDENSRLPDDMQDIIDLYLKN